MPDNPLEVRTAIGTLHLSAPTCHSGTVTVLIRPEAMTLDTSVNPLTGTLVEQSFRGRQLRVNVGLHDVPLEFEIDAATPLPSIGALITFGLRPDAIMCLG
jgi:hypothetical protein